MYVKYMLKTVDSMHHYADGLYTSANSGQSFECCLGVETYDYNQDVPTFFTDFIFKVSRYLIIFQNDPIYNTD